MLERTGILAEVFYMLQAGSETLKRKARWRRTDREVAEEEVSPGRSRKLSKFYSSVRSQAGIVIIYNHPAGLIFVSWQGLSIK